MRTSFLIFLCAVALLLPLWVDTQLAKIQNAKTDVNAPSARQLVWIDALEWRESKGNPKAINPKDSDGTPSYGCLQFKPGTFDRFSEKYGIATTSIMDCDQQRAIVARMVNDPTVKISRQFPLSIREIGLPPVK